MTEVHLPVRRARCEEFSGVLARCGTPDRLTLRIYANLTCVDYKHRRETETLGDGETGERLSYRCGGPGGSVLAILVGGDLQWGLSYHASHSHGGGASESSGEASNTSQTGGCRN